ALLCIERDCVDSLRLHMSHSKEEFRQLRHDRDDFRRKLRRTMTNTRSRMTPAAIEEMINRRVTKSLEAHEINKNLGLENLNENHNNGNGNGNGGNGNGNGNGGNENGGNELTRLQDDVRIANNLMDKKLKDYVVKNAENKRIFDTNHRDNRRQQPPFKRHNTGGQNVARAYTAGNNEKRDYEDTLPYYNMCDPGEGMLTRSMAVKLIAGSVSECLFADFLTEIEPEKVSELDQHLQEPYKNHRIQLLPIEHSAQVGDIVEFETAIAQTFLYLRQVMDASGWISFTQSPSLQLLFLQRPLIKTTEAIKKITRNRKRQVRNKMEQQLAAVQESQRQDRENFKKLQELVTSQLGRHL
nr:retrovirus-related Pol polyprotein from transposon TNT 1-94 [Tanacetum cinerariifolium]